MLQPAIAMQWETSAAAAGRPGCGWLSIPWAGHVMRACCYGAQAWLGQCVHACMALAGCMHAPAWQGPPAHCSTATHLTRQAGTAC